MSSLTQSALDIHIGLQPKQLKLLDLVENSDYKEIGYGGKRYGGKSAGVRRVQIIRRLKHPNTIGIILRRTYKELFQNHIEPLFREYPFMRDWWVEKHRYLDFPNGSKLYFGYAEHTVDVEALFGSEFGDIAVEEAGLFTQTEIQMMKGSCRWSHVPGFKAKMIYSFMPRGRSHFYLKRLFIDRDFLPNENPHRFAFIEAHGWDNIEAVREALARDGYTDKEYYTKWTDEQREAYFMANSDYAQQLLSISDEGLRRAWLYGDWSSFEGIIFPELSDELHNLDNFSPRFNAEGNYRNVSAIDWADSGVTGMEASAIDADENIFFFNEYHERNKTILEHTAAITGQLNSIGAQEYTLMDLPVNNINQDNLFSIQDAFRRAGLNTIQAHRANIAIGLDLMKQMLKVDPDRFHPFTGELGSPRIFISKSRCPYLWKQMAELQQEVDVETGKVKYIGEDDNLDPARYIAMSRPLAPERPKVRPTTLPAFHFEGKAQRVMNQFDKSFGKDPNADSWFPKP